MHSAQWQTHAQLAHKRVGVVGTGASAIQIIPAIADTVDHLHVFQRSPPWIISRWNCGFSSIMKFLFEYVPVCMFIYRFCLFLFQELAVNVLTVTQNWLTKLGKAAFYLAVKGSSSYYLVVAYFLAVVMDHKRLVKTQISVSNTRRKLFPNYFVACKRILKSDDYFKAFDKKNVALHTEAIEKITETGIVCGGQHIELDVRLCVRCLITPVL
jgi:cation diffusion facilitator CzcD-associated flavoprotein CzcO